MYTDHSQFVLTYYVQHPRNIYVLVKCIRPHVHAYFHGAAQPFGSTTKL